MKSTIVLLLLLLLNPEIHNIGLSIRTDHDHYENGDQCTDATSVSDEHSRRSLGLRRKPLAKSNRDDSMQTYDHDNMANHTNTGNTLQEPMHSEDYDEGFHLAARNSSNEKAITNITAKNRTSNDICKAIRTSSTSFRGKQSNSNKCFLHSIDSCVIKLVGICL